MYAYLCLPHVTKWWAVRCYTCVASFVAVRAQEGGDFVEKPGWGHGACTDKHACFSAHIEDTHDLLTGMGSGYMHACVCKSSVVCVRALVVILQENMLSRGVTQMVGVTVFWVTF